MEQSKSQFIWSHQLDYIAKAVSRNMFRLRALEANGQAYEDLFVQIMGYANPNFEPVKPQGSFGDRSNDGYDKESGTYYQVYAPENFKAKESEAITKLQSDFAGLKLFWESICPIKKFYFVANDKYRGVYASLRQELATIKRQHNLDVADTFLTKNLESTLFTLGDELIISIVGHLPKIDPGDFLFLSGFTYFLWAWMDFEKTARALIEPNDGRFRPIVGPQMIRELTKRGILTGEKLLLAHSLSTSRNYLVHGDSQDLPPKEEIDKLVLLTEELRKLDFSMFASN